MEDRKCSKCSSQATGMVIDEAMCEAHCAYWSAVTGKPIIRGFMKNLQEGDYKE